TLGGILATLLGSSRCRALTFPCPQSLEVWFGVRKDPDPAARTDLDLFSVIASCRCFNGPRKVTRNDRTLTVRPLLSFSFGIFLNIFVLRSRNAPETLAKAHHSLYPLLCKNTYLVESFELREDSGE